MPRDRYGVVKEPSHIAIYLSALVWPGAGQYAQKRWLAGTFYAAAFLICVVFLFTAILKPLFLNLRILAEYSGKAETLVFSPIPLAKIMIWTGLSALVYLVSLLNAIVFYRRQRPGCADPVPPKRSA